MSRLLATIFAFVLPLPALALCNGDRFETYLTPQDLVEINETVAATPYALGNYWQAQKDGHTVTILGTMHLPDPRHAVTLDVALPRLTAADLLLVEATQQDQADMQTYMAQNPDMLVITDGPTLPDLLDDATWDTIRIAAEQRGLPGFMVAKMQPWFLALTLSIPTCAAAEMMSGQGGLDALLMDQAATLDIPVAPLESWQEMFALLTSGTFDEQVDALRMGLLEPDLADALMVTLVEDYFAGQTAHAWQMTYYTQHFLPDVDPAVFDEQMAMMEEMLLTQRNANWIPVIEKAALDHKNVFVAFGAAHLIGENGVLRLLETEGWTISPL
ncbi:TraB/GumN family protein [Octadecabacter sp. 1_MG-2023]|uniref:TraB/GumN family protein n=1 Tax=unclassified Octadecabacter TaxID=196158 RepID=UPI001C0A590A|nr:MULTISPECIES: TraB/GumN family protein [unclassified Octadecabacter]MBU2991931.1 TraB/GumN family protein [Octadecabacter sp. B2R22]MDO6735905.1 TraB/GumN family protein [Octadecabacter sp. 1_MG-2023]